MEDNNSNNIKFLIEMRLNIEREYIALKNIIQEKKTQLDELTNIIKLKCEHEWTNDCIDLYPELLEDHPIKYCNKCLLTYDTT